MKWWPGELSAGDLIRVALGSIYHYGIFVSEDEVIQFGPPPINLQTLNIDSISVCTTTAEEFSCGTIIEVAQLDRLEKRKRRSPADTVAYARSKLGQTGYDILRNNCEHFAYDCVFGKGYCSQTEDARKRWRDRPILNVYIAPIPDSLPDFHISCNARVDELRHTKNASLKKAKTYDWAVLIYALTRSFNCDPEKLHFKKNLFGKWSCENYYFSLSHTDDTVAVAVSNGPVGIDLENEEDFLRKYDGRLDAMAKRICNDTDYTASEDFLPLWLKKESYFKAYGHGRFSPQKIEPDPEKTILFRMRSLPQLYASVCGEKIDAIRFFLFENGTARFIGEDIEKGGS